MDLGYARVSTTKQDLDHQVQALVSAGVPEERIYLDKKSGATTERPGLRALVGYARDGDIIVVHTLDRLGRTVRDTLNLIHDLAERGVGVRNLADPIRVDSADPSDPMAQLPVVLLALFAQMERTYTIERAAHARAVRPPRDGGWDAPAWSTSPSSTTPSTCATPGTRSPRSSTRPASPAPTSTATSPPPSRAGHSVGRPTAGPLTTTDATLAGPGDDHRSVAPW